MTRDLLAPVIARKSLANTYEYAGGTVSILLSGVETGGELAIWEGVQQPGGEPPLHVHHTSDETFLVLEGEMRILVGERVLPAPAGSVVFAPRGVPHTFRIASPRARAITLCTPAGFEEWFRRMGRPAVSFDLPARVPAFSHQDFQRMTALARDLQVELLGQVDF